MADELKKQDQLIEMLSAFLDGELSPAQSKKLQRRLDEDPHARQLLKELRQVSAQIGNLPSVSAPPDLSGGVVQQLERDWLLDREDIVAEMAGRKHLRWRRLLTAAAVLVLAGAVTLIVYQVLYNVQNNPLTPSDPLIIANLPENPSEPDKIVGSPDDKIPEQNQSSPPLKTPTINISRLHFVLNETEVPALTPRLEILFKDLQIEDVVRTSLDESHLQFAFICPPETCRRLYQALKNDHNRIDVLVSDDLTPNEFRITGASVDQLMTLAGESNTLLQMVHALRFNLRHTAPDLESLQDISPDLLTLFAQVEPDLTELRAMAPPTETGPGALMANPPSNIGPVQSPTHHPTPTKTPDQSQRKQTIESVPAQRVALVLTAQPLHESDFSTPVPPDTSTPTPEKSPPTSPIEQENPE